MHLCECTFRASTLTDGENASKRLAGGIVWLVRTKIAPDMMFTAVFSQIELVAEGDPHRHTCLVFLFYLKKNLNASKPSK